MKNIKRIIIASDHAGFRLKEKLKSHLEKNNFKVSDAGAYSEVRCDYPEFACKVARAVSKRQYLRGILICKSGIGNSIVANRFSGVRAALCYNVEAALLSREHNDSNVLVLGAHFVSDKLAAKITDIWLAAPFLGGRHRRRLNLLKKIEEKIRRKEI